MDSTAKIPIVAVVPATLYVSKPTSLSFKEATSTSVAKSS